MNPGRRGRAWAPARVAALLPWGTVTLPGSGGGTPCGRDRVAVGNEVAAIGAGAPCRVALSPGDRRTGREADPRKRTHPGPKGRSHPHPCACYRRGTSVFRHNNNPHDWGGSGKFEAKRRDRCGDRGWGHAAACENSTNPYVSTPTQKVVPERPKRRPYGIMTIGATSVRESYLPKGEPRGAEPTRGCATAGACLGPRPLRCARRPGCCFDCTLTSRATTSAAEPRRLLRNVRKLCTDFARTATDRHVSHNDNFRNELCLPHKRTAHLPGRPTIHKPFVI